MPLGFVCCFCMARTWVSTKSGVLQACQVFESLNPNAPCIEYFTYISPGHIIGKYSIHAPYGQETLLASFVIATLRFLWSCRKFSSPKFGMGINKHRVG